MVWYWPQAEVGYSIKMLHKGINLEDLHSSSLQDPNQPATPKFAQLDNEEILRATFKWSINYNGECTKTNLATTNAP